jgi:hypothetical protein
MNPHKVIREQVHRLEDLPNVGKAMAADLRMLGIAEPTSLIGKNPFAMHAALCKLTGVKQDPCVIDVFMSIVSFMEGGASLPWWSFTQQRKQMQVALSQSSRTTRFPHSR